MATRWFLNSLSTVGNAPNALLSHRDPNRSQQQHSRQFITKFFDAVEDTYEAPGEEGMDTSNPLVPCETCAGASHCLNLLRPKEVKIPWGMAPVLLLGTLVGLIHSKKPGKAYGGGSWMLSLFVCLLLWMNFIRFFANYANDRSYGTQLFMKLTIHVWYGQVAVSQTIFFSHISPGLKKLFREWYNYSRHYHCTTAHHIRSHLWRHLIVMVLFLITFTALTVCVIVFEDPYRGSVASKFLLNLPNATTLAYRDMRIFQAFYSAYSIYAVSIWIWPVPFLLGIISGLKYNYNEISAKIAKNYNTMDTMKLENARRQHQKLCTIVRIADDLFSFYSLVIYMTTIPLICFTLYNFAFRNVEDSTSLEMATLVVHLVSLCGQLIILTSASASLSRQAVSPKEELLDVQFDVESKHCHLKAIQVMMFLHRLSHSHIGFTAWKLFNITRTTILTVATMILSNVFVLIKFGLTLEPLSVSNCTSSH